VVVWTDPNLANLKTRLLQLKNEIWFVPNEWRQLPWVGKSIGSVHDWFSVKTMDHNIILQTATRLDRETNELKRRTYMQILYQTHIKKGGALAAIWSEPNKFVSDAYQGLCWGLWGVYSPNISRDIAQSVWDGMKTKSVATGSGGFRLLPQSVTNLWSQIANGNVTKAIATIGGTRDQDFDKFALVGSQHMEAQKKQLALGYTMGVASTFVFTQSIKLMVKRYCHPRAMTFTKFLIGPHVTWSISGIAMMHVLGEYHRMFSHHFPAEILDSMIHKRDGVTHDVSESFSQSISRIAKEWGEFVKHHGR
jgi:hypothetical protein